MDFFLPGDLLGWDELSKGQTQTSEIRGGKYAARVQTGYEKDGSPKYRYFKTMEEYESYMGSKKKKDSKAKAKAKAKGGGDKKGDESGPKKKETAAKKKKERAIFTGGKKKVKKGVTLYLGVDDE